MELPLGGPALRHYTQSRPRPHRQKLNYRPSRPQETIIESENEAFELIGRVDEGVEEFFTKRVLPTETETDTETPEKQEEELITVHEVAPASSAPCPPQTKTLRRKLGDFFTLKKRRGLKSEVSQEGRPKKASIADLIRPLREAARSEKDKEKDRAKDQDKENEKEKAKEPPGVVTAESAVQETPITGEAPLRSEAVPPRRALREGKSQSLILLSGSASTNAKNTTKKPFEGQHSFEQKLHLMLQRIGVSKPQPGETQTQEGEMKKAESEGTIIDNKPEPPPVFSKPRTMSASSDTRHQIRASVSAHEAAGKPALPPKPVIKPAPQPTTSGRNTPENELSQIPEVEANTPAKVSQATAQPPSSALSAPSPAPTTTSELTISNSVSESTAVSISSASTVTHPDMDICTGSVSSSAIDETPVCSTVLDSKASVPETSSPTIELSTATTTTPVSTSLAAGTTDTISVPDSTSDYKSPSVTLNTETITTPQTASVTDQSSVSTTSTDLSTKSGLVEPNGALPSGTRPAAGGDSDIPVITAASSTSISTPDKPLGLSSTISSVPETGDKCTSIASGSCEALVALDTKVTCSPSNSSDTIAAAVPDDVLIGTSSSPTLVPSPSTTSSLSIQDETITSTSCNDMNSVSTNIADPILNLVEISSSLTSSSETNPTDTTPNIPCLNGAVSTRSSAHTNDSTPSGSSNVSSTFIPIVSSLAANDDSSATSHLSGHSPVKDNSVSNVQTRKQTEEDMSVDKEVEEKSKFSELDEKKNVVETGVKTEHESEAPILDKNGETIEEKQGKIAKPDEDYLAEPASVKDSDS